MRVSYYYFLAGVRPASHPLTVSIFAFIVRSIWAIGHVLEIHLHFVVNNCEFFIIHNNSKNILTGFPVFIHFCLLLLYCLIHRCQLCCLVCAAQLALWFLRLTAEAEALIEVTEECFWKGVRQAVAGNRLGDVGHAIQSWAESHGYGVIRDLTGHGIGREMHEDPAVYNFGEPGHGLRLRKGMTLAVEPMINMGTPDVEWMDDEWTVVTADGSLSAHYENTVLITDGDPEILTLTEKERKRMEQ